MIDLIPVYEFARRHNTSEQNVYRWIREGKILKEQTKIIEKTVTRLLILADTPIPKTKIYEKILKEGTNRAQTQKDNFKKKARCDFL